MPPIFTETSRPIWNGCVQEDLLLLKQVRMTDEEDRTITMEVSRAPALWEKTYYPLGRRLWRKLELFSERVDGASQQDLWQEEDDEEHLTVLVEVTPLARPTDQMRMLWIARLELRKRIRNRYFLP